MVLDALDAVRVTHDPPLSVYQPLRQEGLVGDGAWEGLAAALEAAESDHLVTVRAGGRAGGRRAGRRSDRIGWTAVKNYCRIKDCMTAQPAPGYEEIGCALTCAFWLRATSRPNARNLRPSF